MTATLLPKKAEQRLRAELNGDEKLLWAGQPLRHHAWPRTIPFALFGIPWIAFSIFWVNLTLPDSFGASPAPPSPIPGWFPLIGGLIFLLGLWMLTMPYRTLLRAQQTVYALTDKRALILKPTWYKPVTVRSIPPEDLSARTRTQEEDGSGTLIFDRLTTTHRRAGPDGGLYEVTVGFENIPELRQVEMLIDRTFRAPKPSIGNFV